MVFDTNVLLYALLGVQPQGPEALTAVTVAHEIWVPESLWAELVNAVWQWVHFSDTSLETGHAVLRDAEILITHCVASRELRHLALELSVARQHPAYDTLFVALAATTGQRVVTYDRKLLKRFPEWTLTASDYLSAIQDASEESSVS